MKTYQLLKLLALCLILPSQVSLFAQLGVNSDNSAPSSSAMLDVKSTSKGVLIPRIGSDLASPTEGLLYYNTANHNFRYYDGTAWQAALFGNQWNINGAKISYSGGNVGIGITDPVADLVINASLGSNILFQQNAATGNTSTDGLYIGANSSLNGYMFNYENAAVIFGTNAVERMRIDPAGNVGIGDGTPSQKLDVNGSINVVNKIVRPSTGTGANLIPIAYGRVFCNISDDCFRDAGTTNWTLNKLATGHWEINVTEALDRPTNTQIVSITDASKIGFINGFINISTNNMEVKTYNTDGILATRNFSFVIYKND